MAFDVNKFLTDELQLTPDQLAIVAPVLAPKAGVLEGHVLRQQDYSSKLNEVTALQKQIADKDAALTAEAAEWGQLTAAEKKTSGDLRTSLQKTQQESLALKQRLEQVATEAGLDPAKVLEGIVITPPAAPAVPTTPAGFDASKFATAEQFQSAVSMSLNLPAALYDIGEEHRALTGKPVNAVAISTEVMKRAQTRGNTKSLDPRVVWEELNNIPQLRADAAKATYDAEIKAAEDRGAAAARTEMATPTPGAPGRHSVVLTRAVPQKSALQRTQPGEGHNTAVAAFRSGKYRTDAQKPA